MPKLQHLPNLDNHTYSTKHSDEIKSVLKKRLNDDCINEVLKKLKDEIIIKEKIQTVGSLFDYYEDKFNYYPEEDVIKHFSTKELKDMLKFQGKRTMSKSLRKYLNEYNNSNKIYKEHLALLVVGSLSSYLSCVYD